MNDLHGRLAEADPAADLAPLPGARREALLDRAAARPSPPPVRPLLALAALAAAGAVVVAVAVAALAPRPTDRTAGPVIALRAAGADPTSVCAPLADFAVAALRRADLAFDARVTAVSGSTAELVPTEVYRGPATSRVRLRIDGGGGAALDGPVLREGDRVLVAAVDGEVQGCGLSAAASPGLRRYYERAFEPAPSAP